MENVIYLLHVREVLPCLVGTSRRYAVKNVVLQRNKIDAIGSVAMARDAQRRNNTVFLATSFEITSHLLACIKASHLLVALSQSVIAGSNKFEGNGLGPTHFFT